MTDEQIRELWAALRADRQARLETVGSETYDQNVRYNADVYQCRVALGERRANRGWSRAKARACCAEILNTRKVKNDAAND